MSKYSVDVDLFVYYWNGFLEDLSLLSYGFIDVDLLLAWFLIGLVSIVLANKSIHVLILLGMRKEFTK